MGSVVVVVENSISMEMLGLWPPARAAAAALIRRLRAAQSSDRLAGLVSFASEARLINPVELENLSYEPTFDANLAAALDLGLARLGGETDRLIVFTQLVPTAYTMEQGVFSAYPPVRPITEATVAAVRRAGAAAAVIEVRRYLNAGPDGRPRYRTEVAEHVDPVERAIREVGGVVSDVGVPSEPDPSTG